MTGNRNFEIHSAGVVAVFGCLLILMLTPACASAQNSSGLDPVKRELLVPIGEQRKSILLERYAYDLAILDYFAMPGTLELYDFDPGALEAEDETITISPINIPAIEVLSHGLAVNRLNGGHSARWHGELPIPDSDRRLPVEMLLVIRAIDELGNVRIPDPNREVTRSALKQENYVVLEESKERLNEQLVYGLLDGFFQVPGRNATIQIRQLGESLESFGSVVVYEVDNSKTIIPGDDSPVNPTPPTREMIRRAQAFNEYRDRVRREFGLSPIE